LSNGNVTIGAGATTSIGAKLGVRGSGSTSATTSLLVQNSSGNTAFQVKDNLQVGVGDGFGGGDGIRFEASNNPSIVFRQGIDRIGLSRTNGDQLDISFVTGTSTLIGNTGICNDGSGVNFWRFESKVNTPIALDTTGYVKVFINNVAYKLAVCV
jgi:long-subunit fatty acid transport protein